MHTIAVYLQIILPIMLGLIFLGIAVWLIAFGLGYINPDNQTQTPPNDSEWAQHVDQALAVSYTPQDNPNPYRGAYQTKAEIESSIRQAHIAEIREALVDPNPLYL